jgi:GTP-binding protein HflX
MRGGPGEAQIELDRRMIEDRIKSIKERLKKVQKQRGTQRRARTRSGVFRVSLVGYTNAGKSTLFNALVKARVYAADQLFATLDTTTRQLYLEQAGTSVSLSDTVGFIRDLPHKLVVAFRATLLEAVDADLLLHVVDASSPVLVEQMAEVDRVLTEIDAAGIPQILVYNKLDQVEESERPLVLSSWTYRPDPEGQDGDLLRVPRVFVSALDGTGLDHLREQIVLALQAKPKDDLNFAESPSATQAECDPENPAVEIDLDSSATDPTQA